MSCVSEWRPHVNSDTWADIVTELHLKQSSVMQQHLTNIIFRIFSHKLGGKDRNVMQCFQIMEI